MIPRPWLNDEPACLYPQVESQVSVFHSDWICQMRSTRIQTKMKEFRRLDKLDLHKFTAAILNFQASPPRFKRCLRGEKSVRAWHCPSIFGMVKYLLWPTYFALATEFFLHSFPVSIYWWWAASKELSAHVESSNPRAASVLYKILCRNLSTQSS